MNKVKNTLSNVFKAVCGFFSRYIISKSSKMWRFVKPKWLQIALKILGTLIWCVYPFLCFVAIEYINFLDPCFDPSTGEDLKQLRYLFEDCPLTVLFSLTIMYGIAVLLVLLFKRLWASCAVLGSVSIAISLSSFLKYQARNEYFYPWDIQQAGNLGTLKDYINTVIPAEIVQIGIVLGLLCGIVLFTRASLSLRWFIRIPTVIIAVLIIATTYDSPAEVSKLLSKYDLTILSTKSQQVNYDYNGFVAAFSINVLSSSVAEPDGYSKEAITDIIDEYEYIEAGDGFTSPNVILVLQESFYDITKFPNVEFSADPLENFKEISSREGAYAGGLVTSAYGGGTVIPEFESLTGLSTGILPSGSVPYQYIKSNIDSYPSLFKSLGYKTLSVHPFYSSYYLRESKYPHLSFDETWFFNDLVDNIPEIPVYWRGATVGDITFYQYISHFIESTDEPLFLFGISMEGHQPYDTKFNPETFDVNVTSDVMSDNMLNLVNQYTQCVYDADRAIAYFVDFIDNCDEDTILIVYGDHAPTLGTDFAAYRQSGLVSASGKLTGEDAAKIYTTPFMIYANFELSESTMLSTDPTENTLAAYHLMNTALELIDATKTELMQFLSDFYSVVPNYTSSLGLSLTDKMNEYIKNHRLLSYDIIAGKKYSVSK